MVSNPPGDMFRCSCIIKFPPNLEKKLITLAARKKIGGILLKACLPSEAFCLWILKFSLLILGYAIQKGGKHGA